jgi:hypothetical protein
VDYFLRSIKEEYPCLELDTYFYQMLLMSKVFKIEAKIFDCMRYINGKCVEYKKLRFYIKLILKNVLTNP